MNRILRHRSPLIPLALLTGLLTLVGCVAVPADPWIHDLRTDPSFPMSSADLTRDIAAADLVLAGEVHDNPHHHAAQATIVRAAAAGSRPAVVVFEMLDRDQQAAVDAYVAQGGNAAGFAEAVGWRKRGWPDPALYAPLFEAVFDVGATIVAGDLPRATIARVGSEGAAAAPAGIVAHFALAEPLPAAIETQMVAIQDAAHCGLLPAAALPAMVGVQRARDAALADAVVDSWGRNPQARIVLIAGAGHVRKDHGVGALLHARAAGLRTLTIGLEEGGPGSNDMSDLARQFDIVWFTPAAPRPDPCEQLRGRFSK